MKLRLKVLLSISFLFSLTACVETGIEGAVTLGGKIDRGADTQIVIYKQPQALQAFLGETLHPCDTLITDAKGLFLSGTVYDSGMHLFTYQNVSFPLYLLPGKTLNINIDVTKPRESLQFSGGLKHPNRLIRDQHQKAASVTDQFQNQNFEGVDHFMRFTDSARKSLDTLVVQFITNHPRTDKSFMQDRQQFNYYFTGNLMLNYLEKTRQSGDTVSHRLLAAIESFPLHRDELINNAEYLKFAQRKIDLLLTSTQPREVIALIDSLIPAPKTKSTLALRYAKDLIADADSMLQNEHITSFNTVITDAEIREKYNKTLEQAAGISPGTTFTGFEGLDTDSVLRSTAEFRGNPVLFFFGAASCPECRHAFEQLNELQEKHRETSLQFVSVGSKTDFDLWKKHIGRANYPGTALFLKDNAKEVYNRYMINDEPHYLLIAADGRILSRHLKGDIAAKIETLLSADTP